MRTQGPTPSWKTYEEVAVYLLDQVASELGLERVEGTQEVIGRRSGTTWNIEGKGVKSGTAGFVIIECRRYTTSRPNQEDVGALAYRILDTGAQGAIMVSPLGIQEGAAKVAQSESIQTVHMDENSTRTEYIFSFLNRVFLGAADEAHITEDAKIKIINDPND